MLLMIWVLETFEHHGHNWVSDIFYIPTIRVVLVQGLKADINVSYDIHLIVFRELIIEILIGDKNGLVRSYLGHVVKHKILTNTLIVVVCTDHSYKWPSYGYSDYGPPKLLDKVVPIRGKELINR